MTIEVVQNPGEVLLQLITRYGPRAGEAGPLLMVDELFGVKPDAWQEQVLRWYGSAERRISMRSCHGPGKTAVASWCVWANNISRFPQKSVATAPTKSQLEDALLAEVFAWGKRLPPTLRDLYEFKTHRIELKASPSESFFAARTSRAEKPEALQGVHCDEGHVLLIADEASGVPEPVFEAAAGSMSGRNATTLLLSNPVRTSGFFFDTHNKLRDMWKTMHVSHQGSPRVSDDFVEDIGRRYGFDSNAFRIRCLGEFPRSDDDTIIPFELIEAAHSRDVVVPITMGKVWGLDVARFGDDGNVLAERSKLHGKVLDDWGGIDLMQTAGRVKARWDETPESQRPRVILVDSIGLGAGVVDRLRELGLPVRGINVSETASFGERYRNLRTELWFRAREWFTKREGKLEDHAMLATELSLLKFNYTSSGKMMAESKSDLKKRGHKSPNFADAFVLTFAEEPATLIHGPDDTNFSWNQPIKRGIKGIV